MHLRLGGGVAFPACGASRPNAARAAGAAGCLPGAPRAKWHDVN